MALRKLYLGTVGPLYYDDTDDINDPDGDFPGMKRAGIVTDGQMRVTTAPSTSEEVIRKGDTGGATTVQVYAEQANNPSTPTAGIVVNVYMKADKFVLQYNDGGTVKYFTLDLTGTSGTWAYSTVPP